MGESESHEVSDRTISVGVRSEPDGDDDEVRQAANILEGFLRNDWDSIQERSVEHTIGRTRITIDFDNPIDPNSPYVYVAHAPGEEEREAQFGFSVTRPDEGTIVFENDLRQTATKREGYGSDALVSIENSLQHVSNALGRNIEIAFVDIDQNIRQWLFRDNAYQLAPPKPDGRPRYSKLIKPGARQEHIQGKK